LESEATNQGVSGPECSDLMTDLSTYVYIKVTEKKEALCLDPGAVDDRPKGLSSRVLCPRTADPYAAGKTTGQ